MALRMWNPSWTFSVRTGGVQGSGHRGGGWSAEPSPDPQPLSPAAMARGGGSAPRRGFGTGIFFAIVAACEFVSVAPAGDWPQILGPNRDGSAVKESLSDTWPDKGPATVWQRDVGKGFAGVAVADGVCVLFHRVDDSEQAEAMSAATGEVLWTQSFETRFTPSYVDDDGPRAVPLLQGGRAFVVGAMGNLHALDLKTGKVLWTRNTFKDFNSGKPWRGEPAEGYFGFGTSPIVEGDKLILNVGGDEKAAGVVAFDVSTGKTAWTATNERASYSSPVVATVDGVRHLIVATRLNCVSLDPKDGAVRFSLPFGRRGPTVNGASPTVLDGRLFLTASYGIGATWAKIGKSSVEEVWNHDEICSSQYTTCIADDGVLYGIHGRQDVGRAALRCFDPRTQKVLWSKEGFGYATLLKADGKLLAVTTDGEAALIALDKTRFRELARADLLPGTVRALPALSDGRLFVRNEKRLRVVEVGKPARPAK